MCAFANNDDDDLFDNVGAPGRVRITRHDTQQSAIDPRDWKRYFPENRDNSNVGTRYFELVYPASGRIEVYAVWYGGQIENYADYQFELGIELNGAEYKVFDGKGDTSPQSSDPKKYQSNPHFCAYVTMDPNTTFRLYIKYKDFDGKTVKRFSDDGYASLIDLSTSAKSVFGIGFDDSKESEWGSKEPDFNEVVIYIEGATVAPKLESKRFFCETEGTEGDYDYNDIVFDVRPVKFGMTEVRILAVGNTLPTTLTIADQVIKDENGETDLHKIFNTGYVPFNVGDSIVKEPKTFLVNVDIERLRDFTDVKATVSDSIKRTIRYNAHPSKGEALIAVPVGTKWMKEGNNIRLGYPKFYRPGWENEPNNDYLVDFE